MRLSDYLKTAEAYNKYVMFEIEHQFETGKLVAPQAECNCCGYPISVEEIQYIIDEYQDIFDDPDDLDDNFVRWICGDCSKDGNAYFYGYKMKSSIIKLE